MDPANWTADNLLEKFKQVSHIPKGTKIKPILQDILLCKKRGIIYKGDTFQRSMGCKATVITASIEAQILADCLENVQLQRQALEIVNLHCLENNEPPLSISVIQQLVKEMKPKMYG